MNSNRIFDTDVQLVKYKVLKEIITRAYQGGLDQAYYDIPRVISPGPKLFPRLKRGLSSELSFQPSSSLSICLQISLIVRLS